MPMHSVQLGPGGSHDCHTVMAAWLAQLNASHPAAKRPPLTSFWSEHHQDWAAAGVLQTAGILNPRKRGRRSAQLTYFDVGTNDATHGSNTYFFDRCLGWQGVCVEPHPSYHAKIALKRSCSLTKTCIAESGVFVNFSFKGSRAGPTSHIIPRGSRPIPGEDGVVTELRCTRLSQLARQQRVSRVNFMSLDIEGAELTALRSIDWAETSIDTIVIEKATPAVRDFLGRRGLVPAFCMSLDTMYVREPLAKYAAQWYDSQGRVLAPECVTNQTADCLLTPGRASYGASFKRCERARRQAIDHTKGRVKGRSHLVPAMAIGCGVFLLGAMIRWRQQSNARTDETS